MRQNACFLTALTLLLGSASLLGCDAREAENTLVIWHAYRGAEEEQLKEVVKHFEEKKAKEGQPQPVRIVGLPYDAFANKLSNAIPRGNGPDLFIFAHDRLGDWAETDLLEPISFWADEKLADLYLDGTLEPLTYRGDLYGLPTSYKSLVLFYDQTLVDHPPKTTDEMIAQAKAVRAKGNDYGGIAYEIDDLYSHAAWLHGFGGHIYVPNAQNPDECAIDDDKVAQSMLFSRRLLKTEKIFPEEANGSLVTSLFLQHKLAFAVSGPWFVAELEGHDSWATTTLPVVSETGLPAKPFMGVEGVFLSKRSTHKRAAFELMKYLTGDEEAIDRMDKAGQIVANRSAYEKCNELKTLDADRKAPNEGTATALQHRVAASAGWLRAMKKPEYQRCLSHPERQVFQLQAAQTEPMSNRPHMNRVWTPMKRALSNVIVYGKDPKVVLPETVKQIQK